jgi:hypothetical protein
LSAVVAAELRQAGCDVWSCTVRPRGHPFDRHIALADDLERELRSRCGWRFAIVDEGPGLSGSSFCGTALMLNGIGVPDGRIAFFPSWEASGPALRSEMAQRRWPSHRKYTASFEETTAGKRLAGARDLSAGRWREILDAPDVAVQPQHERRKYLLGGRWYKFAGLGPHGSGKLRFSSQYTPATIDFDGGFISMERVAGTPVVAATPALLDTIDAYLGWRAKAFPSRDGSSWEELMEMIDVNATEGVGGGSTQYLRGFRSAVNSAAHVLVDGRMLPHEWLDCGGGRYLKTDAADHHADHFFPGSQSIAWDIAGAVLEFGLPPEAAEWLAGEGRPLMPFYLTAYAAFRLGYATMAVEALGTAPDGLRFERLKSRYAQQLRTLLATEGRRWQ